LRKALENPVVVAVGEAGLDKLVETPMDIQVEVFKEQAVLAEELRKPLIIHCVKAWDELLIVKKKINPQVQWIIHGFRGNRQLAAQLIAQGFGLSFGRNFNQEALQIAWPQHLFAETDEADITIRDVYLRLSDSLNIPTETFASILEKMCMKTFIKK